MAAATYGFMDSKARSLALVTVEVTTKSTLECFGTVYCLLHACCGNLQKRAVFSSLGNLATQVCLLL